MNIEEAILSGVTEEELRADFERQMKAAQASAKVQQKQKDEAKAKAVTAARTDLVTAIVNYTDALGVTPPKDRAEVLEDINKIITATEKEFAEMEALIKSLSALDAILGGEHGHSKKPVPVPDNVDEVIRKFIKTL